MAADDIVSGKAGHPIMDADLIEFATKWLDGRDGYRVDRVPTGGIKVYMRVLTVLNLLDRSQVMSLREYFLSFGDPLKTRR